jgi:hypothetical protein
LHEVLEAINSTADFTIFLTSLLAVTYITNEVLRWHKRQGISWSIQGRLHDLSMLLGLILEAQQSARTLSAKHLFYRHLNLAHVLVYHNKNSLLEYTKEDLVTAGLLIGESESRALQKADTKEVECVLNWIGQAYQQCHKEGLMKNEAASNKVFDTLCRLRGSVASSQDAGDDQPPVSWALTMIVMVSSIWV